MTDTTSAFRREAGSLLLLATFLAGALVPFAWGATRFVDRQRPKAAVVVTTTTVGVAEPILVTRNGTTYAIFESCEDAAEWSHTHKHEASVC